MFHFLATASWPNLSADHFRVPAAVTPRLTMANTVTHNNVLFNHCPSGAPATASEKYKRHSQA